MVDWQQWMGLPHGIGADPRDGEAACCLVIAELILSDAGLNTPDISTWIDLAKSGRFTEIQLLVDKHLEPIDQPAVLSLTLFRNGASGLGVGTVVEENKLLIVHHKRGVTTLPIDRLRLMKFYRLRQ